MKSKLWIHLSTLLGARDSRRLPSQRATYVLRENTGCLLLYYYEFIIIRVQPDGRAVIDTAGQRGPTIKSRLNDCLIHAGLKIVQRNRVWFWQRNGTDLRLPYRDGDVIGVRGKVEVSIAKELKEPA